MVRNRLLLVLAMLATFAALGVRSKGEIPQATDRPKPLPPEQSARQFVVPAGLELDLVACDPMIACPTDLAFDERGRLMVCELHGWNLEGYYDVLELNKTGKLDKEVRRIRASGEALEKARSGQFGRVKVLEDIDGDGRMDRVHVWADRLPPCYGIVPARGGAIVLAGTKIVYLADRDGDGRAEVQEILFEGFPLHLLERAINSPRWGPDGWIYAGAGGSGARVTGPRLARPVQLGHSDFRFRADGSAIEPVMGRVGTVGLTMNDWGERFIVVHGGQPFAYAAPIETPYLLRNPHLPAPQPNVLAANYNRVFPLAPPDPWRVARFKDPAWRKFYGEIETTPQGYFTSACGQLLYRGDNLPSEYRGNYFVCEPANNLVHRAMLERRGSEFILRRPAGEEQRDFLASRDPWFRPVNLAVGPDGALYIADFYHEIIEDYSAIPRFLQQQYVEGLVAGEDKGRVWRVRAVGEGWAKRRPQRWPADMTSAELVPLLEHPNAWQRETAQRLLLERRDLNSVAALEKLVSQSQSPQARLLALYVLDSYGKLRPEHVLSALDAAEYGLRVHAIKLAERFLQQEKAVQQRVVRAVDDGDPRVRLQAVLSLGYAPPEVAVPALVHAVVEHGREQWMALAISCAAVDYADDVLVRLYSQADQPGTQAVISPLVQTLAGANEPGVVGRFLQAMVVRLQDKPTAAQKRFCLEVCDGLLVALSRKPPQKASPDITAALESLVQSADNDLRDRALRLAAYLHVDKSPVLEKIWQELFESVGEESSPLETRIRAVEQLAGAPWSLLARLRRHLAPQSPPELQLAIVRVWALRNADAATSILIERLPVVSPKVQSAILEMALAHRNSQMRLLEALRQNQIPPSLLSSLQRARLLEAHDPQVRELAKQVLQAGSTKERAEILRRYQQSLQLPRDAKRGREIFLKHCASCHRLENEGAEVGPPLTEAKDRPDETLLADILDPSGVIAAGFQTYVVATADGRVFYGILVAETATSITLRQEKGLDTVILRKDIDQMRAVTKSLMPDEMEKQLTPQDVADLLGYLRRVMANQPSSKPDKKR